MSNVITSDQDKRREELSHFLRDRRARVRPEQVGIAIRRRRRTRGLLREEVAEIAGVSVTWYTWLEQARAMNPSARVLEGLASALRLEPAERAHLYRLARPDLNPNALPTACEQLTPSLVAILNGLTPHPAYALNARWDILDWNQPADLLFGGFAHLQASRRNVLHRLLFDPVWRDLFIDWECIVASAVAQFRATTVHLAADPIIEDFVERLRCDSPMFATLWERREIAQPNAMRKTVRHTSAGDLTFDYATFRPDGAARDVRFTIYTPADSRSTLELASLLDGK